MNLRVLFLLLFYYAFISIFFIAVSSHPDTSNYNVSINLNDSQITDSEIDTGGIFNTGISFTRFTTLILFGVGLPEDTPTFFSVSFAIWQTMMLIFTIGFIISAIWNG